MRWAPRTRTPGFGPVLNPWDRSRVPGGSSGGSAAAVAAGLAPWAIGTDTGGSIRQPAALCGIVGLKPTYGACSRYGMIAFASSLDQAGPLARDVTDAALLFKHMVGRDRCDSTSLAFPEEIATPRRQDLSGVRLGVPEELTGSRGRGTSQACGTASRRPLKLAERPRRGGRAVPPAARAPRAVGLLPDRARGGVGQPRPLRRRPLRAARRRRGRTWSRCTAARAPRASAREVKRRIMLGTYALSSGYYDAYYGTAQKVRTKISEDFKAAFERFDFIVTPTSPWTAFELGAKTDDPLAMYLNDFCTVPMPLAGIPAISIPVRAQRRAPGRVSARRAGVQREPAARRGVRARAGDRLRRERGPADEPQASSTTSPSFGLEIHVQLSTRTKMFCGCELSFGDPPNTHTCPRCLGLPGTLPVVNARAVHFGLMIGLALELRDRPALDLPPQELLLSRPAQGLPDLPVRHPAVRARPTGRRADPPRAPGGGRRQAQPPR